MRFLEPRALKHAVYGASGETGEIRIPERQYSFQNQSKPIAYPPSETPVKIPNVSTFKITALLGSTFSANYTRDCNQTH